MNEFDVFPTNLLEMSGPINRSDFEFYFSKVLVWQGGKCVDNEAVFGCISGLVGPNKHLSLIIGTEINALKYVQKESIFPELSTNYDRIMWSTDLLNSRGDSQPYQGTVLSLMYKSGDMVMLKLNVDNPVPSQIEFIRVGVN